MAVHSSGYGYGYDNGYGYGYRSPNIYGYGYDNGNGYGYAHVCGRSMALFMYDVVGLAGAMVVA